MDGMDAINSAQMMLQSKQESCKNCGGMFFDQAFMIRRLSKLVIGAPTDQLIPIPVLKCTDCGMPIEDMIPNIKDDEDDKIIKLQT